MLPWKIYNSQLFVDRPEILNKIRDWANTKEVEYRIWYLLAPPGAGKTWILKTLYSEWSIYRLILWVDVPSLVQQDQAGRVGLWNMPAFTDWIKEIQADAQKYCPDLPPIDLTLEQENIISSLVELLCNCNPDMAPIIIVDGYDEISTSQSEEIGYRLLDRLVERACMCMLIAHRDEGGIYGQVITRYKRNILLNGPLPNDFAKKQFEYIVNLIYPAAKDLSIINWMKTELKHYCWDHPFINAYLFNCVLERCTDKLETLKSQDLEECCKEAIERHDENGVPRHPPLAPEEWMLLVDLATRLPDEWIAADLDGIEIPSVLDPRFQKLLKYGLIFSKYPFFLVAPGYRELLLDMKEKSEMEKQENEGGQP
jgi:hypothetical protein